MFYRPLLIILGFISLALGILGAFLPVLPTTPFAILSAYLFSKSSPRLHQWMLGLPILGPAVLEWQKHKVIRPRAKFVCTVLIILTIGSSIAFADISFELKIMLVIIGISVLTFVLSRRSHPLNNEND
jgi:uncharacterized membrane protein YbaN (DUF454 family)